ncbi:MAG: hypothetical protein EOP48_22280, partial [Sphingobacteriales bacterium]
MSNEELEERIFYLKDRYHFLELSREQSEKMVRFEAEQEKYGHLYFSDYETWDYELLVFQDILSPEQIEVYRNVISERKVFLEKSVAKSDEDYEAEKRNLENLIRLYTTSIVPSILADPSVQRIRNTDAEKAAYLRSVYRKSLLKRQYEIIVDHLRFHRNSNRKELEINLLKNRVLHIYPSWSLFSEIMDPATSVVAEFIYEKLPANSNILKQIFIRTEREIFEANKEYQDYVKQNPEGALMFSFEPNEAREQKDRLMSLLLIDENFY